MNVSLIVTCGYIKHTEPEKLALELERLGALRSCLFNLTNLNYSAADEVVVVEYGVESKLKNIVDQALRYVKHQYVFVQGTGFNQSKAKNAGGQYAKNEILCWINSDVLLQSNILDVLRSRFEKNNRIFATAARHDIFNITPMNVQKIISEINIEQNYTQFQTAIDDPGWHHALGKPKTAIPTSIKSFVARRDGSVIHDFQHGYINYGELMAVSKDIWQKYPFDEDITAIVDSFYRDMIFGSENEFGLELIHDQSAIFHLSGSDFMGQEKKDSNKYIRLIADMRLAAERYPIMRHWLVFSYFPEFDDLIEKYNIPFREIFEKWSTPFLLKFYREKELAKMKYHVEIN